MGAAIIGALIAAAGTLLVQFLLSASIGVVTYSGITYALDFLRQMFMDSASGLPAGVVGLLGILKVGTSFSILMSAVTMRLTLSGVQGTVSRFKIKGGAPQG
ncbi:hypothetical protein GCM10027046_04280 [Uliginosibacterium flavum]|uniref:DUF2523 domain-containing protein n=1 Tax=Uliginosibacterium flavum TaxID=1396831 RepID=A0ABV2TJB2_9RHOO